MVYFYSLLKVKSMPTLNQRISELEKQASHETFTTYQLAMCTDEELLGIFLMSPYYDGSHEKFVPALEPE